MTTVAPLAANAFVDSSPNPLFAPVMMMILPARLGISCNNMNEVVSVDNLARLSNMSASGFRKSFRAVMHMPPLQYAKSIKLNRAQTLIREGKNASEAGYLVGYNSPAQFSR